MSLGFADDAALIAFAQKFVSGHIKRFRKDIQICLRPNTAGSHAYFPSLMACVGFLDLFSGLLAGKLKGHGFSDLENYTNRFCPELSDDLLLAVLYYCFRHKVAHLAHPFDVFDTDTAKDGAGQKIIPQRRLIAWLLNESNKAPAIRLAKLNGSKPLRRAPPGWNVKYDHVVYVHIGRLARISVQSVLDESGYLQALRSEPTLRGNFAKCMREYFPV